MDKNLKTTFKKLENKFWNANNKLGQVTYDLVSSIVLDEGGRISFTDYGDVDDADDEKLSDIFYAHFSFVPYADKNETTIWYGDAHLKSLYVKKDGRLFYELEDGRCCGFEWLPPYYATPICTGLFKWCNIIRKYNKN